MRILLLLCAVWMLADVSAAVGQPARPAGFVSQPLDEALSEFAAQTGLQVIYVSKIVASLKANAVPPGLAPTETLGRMLAGTGLEFEYLNARTVRIFPDDRHGPAQTGSAAFRDSASSPRQSAGESARLNEVIVTATHQAEWASDVPMSLTVWSHEAMRISGVKGINEIGALTPGLSFDWRSNIGAGVYTNLDMRGITGMHGVSTGVFIDEAAMPAAWHDSYNRAFPSTFDLERVEVLRGAQGMLLGQGTLGGAIRFITTQPSLSTFTGHATAELATTEDGAMSYEAGAAAGGPVVGDVLGIRVSGWYRSEGGFIDHIDPLSSELARRDTNGTTSKSGRIGLAWMATDATRITSQLIVDSNRTSDSAAFFVQQSDPARGIFRNSNFIRQPREDRFYLATLKVEHEFDAVNLLAATSYIDRENHSIHDLNCFDDCGMPLFVFVLDGGQRVIQQELRLASADPEARFTWVTGAHFSQSESRGRSGGMDIPVDEREGTNIDQTQVEGYLQISRELGTRVRASAGARVARSSYDFASLPAARFTGAGGESLVIPRFDLAYRSERGNLFYLTAAKGYGGSGVVPVIAGCEPLEFLADTVWNYELGAKADLLEGRAHVEASVFDSRWSNRQRDAFMFACLAGFQKGPAASDGFELSGHALVGERATIGLEVSYIDARYTHSVQSNGVVIVRAGDAVHGARLPWSLSAFFDYELPPVFGINLVFHAEDHFQGGNPRRRLESNPDSPFYQAFATSYMRTNILNLRADARVGRANIALFVNNALDSHPVLNRSNFFGGCCVEDAVQTAYTLTPRTLGFSATWRF